MKILQDSRTSVDAGLLEEFDREIWATVPHLEGGKVSKTTPLVDLTQMITQSAKDVFGLDLSKTQLRVFGKVEAELPGGSVKMRPAVQIVRSAIASGKLRRGQTVFDFSPDGRIARVVGFRG